MEQFENAPITGRFGFIFGKRTWAGKSRDYRDVIVFKTGKYYARAEYGVGRLDVAYTR